MSHAILPEMGASGPERPASWFESHPHARISFSRLAVWRRCPGWYRHQYLEWHRVWNPPVTRAGHAVQEAFEECLHQQPPPGISAEKLSSGLMEEAERRFRPILERERLAHEEDPNGYGPWDLDRDRYEGYLKNGLRWHLEEAEARLERRHPRTGRPLLELEPLPDLAAAFRAVLPWHVPSKEPLSGMESVPGGFFQGQYDLVYTWTGGRRIVDLKASTGASPFSSEINLQLLAYTYLEVALGRGLPEGLEAWFLGQEAPRIFPVPKPEELLEFERTVLELLDRSGSLRGFGAWNPDDFPVQPTQVDGHAKKAGDASCWCALCPAAPVCSKASAGAPGPGEGVPLDHLQGAPLPLTLEGLCLGVGPPLAKPGKITRRFSLAQGGTAFSVTWEARVVERLIQQGLRAGRVVRLFELRPWTHPASGNVLLYPTPGTEVEVLAEA